MLSFAHPTLTWRVLAARINRAAAVLYVIAGLFGIPFVSIPNNPGPAILFVGTIATLFWLHLAIARGAERGSRWAKRGSILGAVMLILLGFAGAYVGPIIGAPLLFVSLKSWSDRSFLRF